VKRAFGVVLLLGGIGTATASAQQITPTQAPPQASTAAAAALPPLGKAAKEHQFGVGVRVFPESGVFGIGGGIRYFMGGPFGFQVEAARFSIGDPLDDISANQFSAAVIYRISEHTFEAPLSLVPYAGGGVNILRGKCHDDRFSCVNFFDLDAFEKGDENSVGALVFGGAELFFKKVPKLSVSGEITFTSNNDLFGGGGRGTIAGHWYFR
jgi:hypothetical protein